jgi:hypothetical protein
MVAPFALALLLHQAPPEWVVKPGDTCASIAKAVWGDARAYDRLHAANRMGPPPHTLVPGQRLALELVDAGLASARAAELSFVKPAVEARSVDAGWAPGEQGQSLYRLDEVNTQARAAAVITFDDSSALRMRENAFVVVLGPPVESSKAARAPGLELRQGEATVSLATLKGLPISTPGAQLVAQGKALWLDVDSAAATRLAAHAGSATVSAQGKAVRVAQGQGTRVKQGEPPEPPTALPKTPAWGPAPDIAIGPLVDGGVAVSMSWSLPRGTALVRIEASMQASFDAIAHLAVGTDSATLLLPPGAYVTRLAGIDGRGLLGTFSVSQPLEVVALPTTAAAPWLMPPSATAEILVDGQPVTAPIITPGRHQVRVRRQTTTRQAEVMVVLPALEISIVKRHAVVSGAIEAISNPSLALVDATGKPWPLRVEGETAQSEGLPDGAYTLRWLTYPLATAEVP